MVFFLLKKFHHNQVLVHINIIKCRYEHHTRISTTYTKENIYPKARYKVTISADTYMQHWRISKISVDTCINMYNSQYLTIQFYNERLFFIWRNFTIINYWYISISSSVDISITYLKQYYNIMIIMTMYKK